MNVRIGLGFDSHPFQAGKPLKLGGVEIDFPLGLMGHSDGDVLLHAITDAILGALSEQDIGQLFPDTDLNWKDASSELFLKEAVRRMKERGYRVASLDCVLIADQPRIAPHKDRIRERLSSLLETSPERISLKGKSREGFCKEDGIACMCVVLLVHEG